LGDHVPYAVEAWPEGDQRHLSAESGLYARVIIEGLFGIEPTGFKSFKMKPVLPSSWDFMNLKHIKAFKSDFNIEVTRKGDAYKVVVTNQGKDVYNQNWDGKSEILIDLGK
jgi:cellobiose phosphorylase